MKMLLALSLSFAAVAAVGCHKDKEANSDPAQPTRFDIAVTEKGFEPDNLKVPAGKPVTLVFDRKTDKTCAKQVVIKMADATKIEKDLPLNTPVEVATTFPTAGKLTYACGMDMLHGALTVE